MTDKKILVLGADGQLGSELRELSLMYPQMEFTLLGLVDIDVTNGPALENVIASGEYQYCINCAAYTAVDKAETETEKAFNVNDKAVGYLGLLCSQHGVKPIHISTDFVFSGRKSSPYVESDPTGALGAYGASKEAGERALMQTCPDAVIFRTSWLYSSYGYNFVKTMIRLGKERDEISVVADQVGTPTYARDLASMIVEQIENGNIDSMRDIYHFSDEGVASWYDLAMAVMEFKNLPCHVKPISTEEYPTPAARPAYSVLNKSRIKEELDLTIPYWRDSLRVCIERID